MEYAGTINKSNILYVPEKIRDILGMEILMITSGKSVFIVPKGTSKSTIIKYLDLMKEQILIEEENKSEIGNPASQS